MVGSSGSISFRENKSSHFRLTAVVLGPPPRKIVGPSVCPALISPSCAPKPPALCTVVHSPCSAPHFPCPPVGALSPGLSPRLPCASGRLLWAPGTHPGALSWGPLPWGPLPGDGCPTAKKRKAKMFKLIRELNKVNCDYVKNKNSHS